MTTHRTSRYAYQERLGTLLHDGGGAAVREALGSQFAMLRFDDSVQGWRVGLAPGVLNLERARAAIADRLRTRFSTPDVAHLTERLHVDAQPYSEAELREVQAALDDRLIAADWHVGWTTCASSSLSDAYRVVVELFDDSTPDIVAQARALVAEYGDRARLVVRGGGPPAQAA